MLIEDGIIRFIGSNADANQVIKADTQIIDLEGEAKITLVNNS